MKARFQFLTMFAFLIIIGVSTIVQGGGISPGNSGNGMILMGETCSLGPTDVEIDDSMLIADKSLGLLPAENVPGGTLGVRAGANYDLDVREAGTTYDGKMAQGTTSLKYEFIVTEGSANKVTLGSGPSKLKDEVPAIGNCEFDSYSVSYSQGISALDAIKGRYNINLIYIASID